MKQFCNVEPDNPMTYITHTQCVPRTALSRTVGGCEQVYKQVLVSILHSIRPNTHNLSTIYSYSYSSMVSRFSFAAPLLFAGSLFGPQKVLAQETGSYEFAGDLNKPYQPAGGIGVDATDPPPVYAPLSNFDFQSLVRITYFIPIHIT